LQLVTLADIRRLFWVVNIRQKLADFSNPEHDRTGVNLFDPSNSSKARAVDIHQQTFTLKFLAVAAMGFVVTDELSATISTEVLLLALSIETIFADVLAVTFWAVRPS
jgi:hypothetical protein